MDYKIARIFEKYKFVGFIIMCVGVFVVVPVLVGLAAGLLGAMIVFFSPLGAALALVLILACTFLYARYVDSKNQRFS